VLLSVLSLDIGGANLKAAHSSGHARCYPYELWKDPAGLADALRRLLQEMPRYDRLAVTMTGELCDCFASKRDGVNAILDAVSAVAGATPVHVWQTDGSFVDITTAKARPLQTAAANWLALATFAGRYASSGYALLIDIGSTTTDIVPLHDGKPIPQGRTDPERLRNQELVYTGVRRTPLCALLGPSHAAEWFATTLDVYLLLDKFPEDDRDRNTADGRPATRAAAHARLARMLCTDLETSTQEERYALAHEVHHRQVKLLREAIGRVVEGIAAQIETVVLSGSGEFLGRAALEGWAPTPMVSLAEKLGPEVSQVACAYALSVLAIKANYDAR
jgi:probable H4MPT-linked C1 transfer pathway protein